MLRLGHMITFSTLKRAVLTGTAAILLPATVLAATPQQMLNTAIKANLKAPYRLGGEIKIDITDKPVVRTERTKTANIVMRFNQRVQNETAGSEAGEGSFTLASFRASGEQDGDPDLTLGGPMTFEWKNIGRVSYVKISSLPSELTEQLTVLDIDLSKLTNRWIKIDLTGSEDGILSQIPLAPELPIDPTSGEMSLSELLNLSRIQPLIVSRVESRKTLADGRNIIRLRVRVNPSFVNELQRIDRAKIERNDPERTEKLTELNEKYVAIRKFIANLHMAMEMDTSTERLTRIEMGGRQSEPTKACEMNARLKREVCKIVSYKTISYAIGINIETDRGEPVVPPSDATDLMTIFEELAPTPEPEPIVEEEESWDYSDEWEMEYEY